MVTRSQSAATPAQLAQQVRERFVLDVDRAILALGNKIQLHLTSASTTTKFASMAEARLALDAAAAFRSEHDAWVAQVRQQWQGTLTRAKERSGRSDLGALGLVDDEVVERKILASRLAAAVTDAAGSELNDLRVRVQWLDRVAEWGKSEVLAPETLSQILVQAWTDRGLAREMWGMVDAPVSELLCASMTKAYRQANELLVSQGVMAEIDMRARVRRADGGSGPTGAAEDSMRPDEDGQVQAYPERGHGPGTSAPGVRPGYGRSGRADDGLGPGGGRYGAAQSASSPALHHPGGGWGNEPDVRYGGAGGGSRAGSGRGTAADARQGGFPNHGEGSGHQGGGGYGEDRLGRTAGTYVGAGSGRWGAGDAAEGDGQGHGEASAGSYASGTGASQGEARGRHGLGGGQGGVRAAGGPGVPGGVPHENGYPAGSHHSGQATRADAVDARGYSRYAPGDSPLARAEAGGQSTPGGRSAQHGGRFTAGDIPATGPGGPLTQTPTVQATALARAAQETRMMTAATPMARVRQRAQGVLGQLRRLISDRVSDFDETAAAGTPSPRLARALAEPITPFAATEWVSPPGASGAATGAMTQPLVDVRRVATQLRQRATDLKEKADKPSEKAIIEIVALMFQAILAEERIPAAIRVWFARLQIPVLRLALAEPDFFASIQHPARQLIDRMGACVLGFDGSQVLSSRLEREIKRVVQVIEQYPETGRRVYQLVLDEFKKFLGRSLSDTGAIHQAATLAQQVEQKEALSIQYTIELRRMLDPVPVADDVREFLFRVWSDVLALSAVRYGAQHAQTLSLKQAAADLLWAVSPKPDRDERRRVVQQLSGLLQALRSGMSLLAMPEEEQDGHIKLINDAVTAAFVSRDEGLPQAKLDDLARGLAGLEDVVTDDPEGDLLLDPGMIELMFGGDEAALEVIASGGSLPSDGMLEWARTLELGAWFSLEVAGKVTQVQYAWRSARGQLHLFSAGVGKSFLVQTRRMAAYLQAGLLVPTEDEALTVRATRQALAKLNADPDRLLH